jgi:hypothetical protein
MHLAHIIIYNNHTGYCTNSLIQNIILHNLESAINVLRKIFTHITHIINNHRAIAQILSWTEYYIAQTWECSKCSEKDIINQYICNNPFFI